MNNKVIIVSRSSGSYSGRNYDRWAYEQAASNGSLADTPINRLQHKFWVAKQVGFSLQDLKKGNKSLKQTLCSPVYCDLAMLHLGISCPVSKFHWVIQTG